jgi:hypothetical protein
MAAMGLECDMELSQESSQEELLVAVDAPNKGGARRRTFTLVAGLLTMFATTAFLHKSDIMTKMKGGFLIGLDEEVGAASEEGCAELPFVKINAVISSNLGKQGPDHDAEEGIIYNATAYHTGSDVSNLQIHVHSLKDFANESEDHYDGDYRPSFTHGDFVNGLHGKFADINVKPGESVRVRAHAYDADKNEDIPLPHSAISFFDLDAGKDGTHSVEHVSVRGFKDYYLSNETEVNVTTDGDLTVFTATTEGTGDDNPSDPTVLTVQQKNRAVTLEFEDTKSIDFEIGATAGATGRVFSFVFRPSLLCAKTKLADGTLVGAMSSKAPIEPVESAAHKELPSVAVVFGFLSVVVPSLM